MAEATTAERKASVQSQNSPFDITFVVQIFKNVLLLDKNPKRVFTYDLHLFLQAFDDPRERELIKFTIVSGLVSRLGSLYPIPKDAIVTSVKSYPLKDINHVIIKITYTTANDHKGGETCIEIEQIAKITTNDSRLEDLLRIYVVPCEKIPKEYPKYTILEHE
ncbi:MAG: hypothetical protein QW430_12155 [Metallosphaera sp.]|uniref:hypothetical protein n=1 Tax=Metallosphaera sp. TaxID=2020860 RepID=UPI003163BE0D